MSILEVYTEKGYWLFSSKEKRKYLLPVYYFPIIPIVIQPRVKVLNNGISGDDELAHEFLKEIELTFGESSYQFSDIKADNLGWYNGKIIKIDYGFPYVIHNLITDIKRRING